MLFFLLLSAIFAYASGDVQLTQLRKMPNLPKPKIETTAVEILDQNQLSYCEACWGVADEAIEVWLEIFLYSGTFATCAEFCTVVETWGTGCIAVCAVLGDEAFFKLLNATDLDPVYVCQLISACPVDDCVGMSQNI